MNPGIIQVPKIHNTQHWPCLPSVPQSPHPTVTHADPAQPDCPQSRSTSKFYTALHPVPTHQQGCGAHPVCYIFVFNHAGAQRYSHWSKNQPLWTDHNLMQCRQKKRMLPIKKGLSKVLISREFQVENRWKLTALLKEIRRPKAAIFQSRKKTALSKSPSWFIGKAKTEKQYLTSWKGETDQIAINTNVTWRKFIRRKRNLWLTGLRKEETF